MRPLINVWDTTEQKGAEFIPAAADAGTHK